MEDDGENATSLPCDQDILRFVAFRPDEVEEECSAEDECHEDTGEDVVRARCDVVVVVDLDSV